MRGLFSSFHPLVAFVYFLTTILLSIAVMNPLFLAISLCGGFALLACLQGSRSLRSLALVLPGMAAVAVINPLFNHSGQSVLLYINEQPFTAEALIYGLTAAAMLCAACIWFACYNAAVSSDSFIWLFGRAAPSLTLVFSMTLRMVPLLTRQAKVIASAQKGIGRLAQKGIRQKMTSGIRIFAGLMTWAFENAVITADSMRARGYGLRGRTRYSNFRFGPRDCAALLWLGLLCAGVLIGAANGTFHFSFFPVLAMQPAGGIAVFYYGSWALLCLFGPAAAIWEECRWTHTQSKG